MFSSICLYNIKDMYSIDRQNQNKNHEVEVTIRSASKWKRTLLYLGDLMISFIVAVLLLTVVVMPIASIFVKPRTDESLQAERDRDDILFEHQLLFYKDYEEEAKEKPYAKYNHDGDLRYSFNRWLAYYIFNDSEESLDPDFPEYKHLEINETIRHFYVDIRSDAVTYKQMFVNHASVFKNEYFTFPSDFPSSNAVLGQEYIDNLKPYFNPNDKLGKLGEGYYEDLSDLYAALTGVMVRNILKDDLTIIKDGKTYSYKELQALVDEINFNYNLTIAICSLIAFTISWALVYILYPLLNQNHHTPTMSVMKLERLGIHRLDFLSKGEAAMTAVHYFLFNLPYLMFLSLSYTTLLFSFGVPLLPFFTILGMLMVVISFFVLMFNGFDRTLGDILSHSVIVPSEDVDGIIKAKETIEELKAAERRKNNNEQ